MTNRQLNLEDVPLSLSILYTSFGITICKRHPELLSLTDGPVV